MKTMLSNNPNTVVYRYSRQEFQQIIETFLSEQAEEPVKIDISLHLEFRDPLDINLRENEMSWEALDRLVSKGFDCDEPTELKYSILDKLFHPKHSVDTYVISENQELFDVLIHIPYEAFIDHNRNNTSHEA